MKRLLISITNRSSYNKVKTIVDNLPINIYPIFLLGGSVYLYKYGNVYGNIINDFGEVPIFKTNNMVDGESLSKMPKTVGLGTIEVSTILENIKPDAVLTVADRFETMSIALSASYMNIPLIHLQGGEISGTIDNKVRNAITQLADYHFPSTELSLRRIKGMRSDLVEGNNLFNFGCPSMDLLTKHKIVNEWYNVKKKSGKDHDDLLRKFNSFVINRTGNGDFIDFDKPYNIIILHQDTVNPFTEKEILDFCYCIDNNQKVIFWNNIDPGGDMISKAWRTFNFRTPTRFVRHINQDDFGSLLAQCSCIIGNSSTGIREASFMGKPSVTVGKRQHDRECGANIKRLECLEYKSMRSLIDLQCNRRNYYFPSGVYGDGNAGIKIAEKIGEII